MILWFFLFFLLDTDTQSQDSWAAGMVEIIQFHPFLLQWENQGLRDTEIWPKAQRRRKGTQSLGSLIIASKVGRTWRTKLVQPHKNVCLLFNLHTLHVWTCPVWELTSFGGLSIFKESWVLKKKKVFVLIRVWSCVASTHVYVSSSPAAGT